MEVICGVSIANVKSEEGIENIAQQLLHRVSKSELASFIKRLTFYIEHINILNKTLKNSSYESQLNVLNNLRTKLQEESEYRSLSVNAVAKSYQEAM